jgi:hypothetical protein
MQHHPGIGQMNFSQRIYISLASSSGRVSAGDKIIEHQRRLCCSGTTRQLSSVLEKIKPSLSALLVGTPVDR